MLKNPDLIYPADSRAHGEKGKRYQRPDSLQWWQVQASISLFPRKAFSWLHLTPCLGLIKLKIKDIKDLSPRSLSPWQLVLESQAVHTTGTIILPGGPCWTCPHPSK